ncbi:hypothetical protein [Vibrio sp. D431a]|uniref:hypothetical protein n=1 Tax=Vibrio sp. D431a TaxID=2837388 RepID=UPI00255407C8|nr:hypothetical protein [Vibrio sp. D431a]MDK9789989.1 hypothetical protein [Vibrio sp. D431a]
MKNTIEFSPDLSRFSVNQSVDINRLEADFSSSESAQDEGSFWDLFSPAEKVVIHSRCKENNQITDKSKFSHADFYFKGFVEPLRLGGKPFDGLRLSDKPDPELIGAYFSELEVAEKFGINAYLGLSKLITKEDCNSIDIIEFIEIDVDKKSLLVKRQDSINSETLSVLLKELHNKVMSDNGDGLVMDFASTFVGGMLMDVSPKSVLVSDEYDLLGYSDFELVEWTETKLNGSIMDVLGRPVIDMADEDGKCPTQYNRFFQYSQDLIKKLDFVPLPLNKSDNGMSVDSIEELLITPAGAILAGEVFFLLTDVLRAKMLNLGDLIKLHHDLKPSSSVTFH